MQTMVVADLVGDLVPLSNESTKRLTRITSTQGAFTPKPKLFFCTHAGLHSQCNNKKIMQNLHDSICLNGKNSRKFKYFRFGMNFA